MSNMIHHPHDLPAAVLEPKRRTQLAYILAYRAPDYIRSQSLLQALGNCSHIELLIARNRNMGVKRYAETWRALCQLRKAHSPDIYLLGFRGHEMFWPVRWLTREKPLVFDALMSPSAALREENKAGWLGRLLAPVMHHLERSILQRADLVLTDTTQHAAFYETQFGLPKEKILVIPVGAVETGASSEATEEIEATEAPFNVLFYGSMLPLHGIDIIVSAAAQLSDLPIHFDFVGGNAQQAQRLQDLCTTYGVTRYTHRFWVPLDELIAVDIPRTDLCLGGPFGGTPQARRVITGKTSQCLALGKATIIGAIDEDTGFVDKHNCLLVPQADATALATALRWSFAHRDTLPGIGQHGQALYHERLSVHSIAQQLIPTLLKLREAHHGKP
ncbi:glycosyltransferase [Rhodanobacter soli]